MASKLGDEFHQDLNLDRALRDYALFLDVDGTLLPIAARPHEVQVSSDLLTLLGHLHEEFAGAVAFVSGRAIADLDALFAPLTLPAAGVHGLERRSALSGYTRSARVESLDPLRQPLAELVKSMPDLLLEDKGLSLALHYRTIPHREAEIERYLTEVMAKTTPTLELARGKMVFEVKPKGCSKGSAIEAFMTEQPFRGRLPIFLGDDVTDEDGFAVINRLGGLSVKVGASGSTSAARSLPNEAAVHAWLQRLSENTMPR